MPKKDDNFAEDTFNSINNDLDGMRAQTTTYMLSTARRNIVRKIISRKMNKFLLKSFFLYWK